MILVDTSAWIHMLRPSGDPIVRARVTAALTSGQACWCPPVQLELWNGARGEHERKVLRDFSRTLPELPIDEKVWQAAYNLARLARIQGLTVPAVDLTIAACARRHGAWLESDDSHFALLASVEGKTGKQPT